MSGPDRGESGQEKDYRLLRPLDTSPGQRAEAGREAVSTRTELDLQEIHVNRWCTLSSLYPQAGSLAIAVIG